MGAMKYYFTFTDKLGKIVHYTAAILLAAMVTLFFVQTLLRFMISYSMSWAEEACRDLFIWSSLLEASVGITKDLHVGFDLIIKNAKGLFKRCLTLVINILITVFGFILFYYGSRLVSQGVTQLSTSLQIPMSYIYMCIPICGVLSMIFAADNILRKVVATK